MWTIRIVILSISAVVFWSVFGQFLGWFVNVVFLVLRPRAHGSARLLWLKAELSLGNHAAHMDT